MRNGGPDFKVIIKCKGFILEARNLHDLIDFQNWIQNICHSNICFLRISFLHTFCQNLHWDNIWKGCNHWLICTGVSVVFLWWVSPSIGLHTRPSFNKNYLLERKRMHEWTRKCYLQQNDSLSKGLQQLGLGPGWNEELGAHAMFPLGAPVL